MSWVLGEMTVFLPWARFGHSSFSNALALALVCVCVCVCVWRLGGVREAEGCEVRAVLVRRGDGVVQFTA